MRFKLNPVKKKEIEFSMVLSYLNLRTFKPS